MSTGTKVITRALQSIGAASVLSPAAPESIIIGLEKLNSMLSMWITQGITKTGMTVPILAAADELHEPPDVTNAIITNLAIAIAPSFDNGKQIVSPELRAEATNGFNALRGPYEELTIPDKTLSSTAPMGSGNYRRFAG